MPTSATGTATAASAPSIPSLKLCRRVKVKDFTNIARTDAKFDLILDSMISNMSRQVQQYCQRQFVYGQRTEFHESYDQDIRVEIIHEDPQYVHVEAVPIDLTQPVDLRFSFDRDWDNSKQLVLNTDFYVDDMPDSPASVIRVFPERVLTAVATSVVLALRQRTVHTHPMGFRITYTGGFPVVTPGGDCLDNDETFVNVPEGLQDFVAMKVAMHFVDRKNTPLVITSDDRQQLTPYLRRGKLLGR